jgi:hypothetical protein
MEKLDKSLQMWCNDNHKKKIYNETWLDYLRFMPGKPANVIFLSTDIMVEDALVATSRRK